MIYIVLNAVPIGAATLAGVIFAALWFRARPTASVVLTFVIASGWLAAILAGALILAPNKGGVWVMTLGSAFVIWIGFVLPAISGSYRWRALPWMAMAADAGCWLGVMLVQATILRLVGLTPPPV